MEVKKIELWYAEDDQTQVAKFFTALTSNLPDHPPYSSITEVLFPVYEFSDKSPLAKLSPKPGFEKLRELGWEVRQEDTKVWKLTRNSNAVDFRVQLECHNFWFHYLHKISSATAEEFVSHPKDPLVGNENVFSGGASMIRDYAYVDKRLIAMVGDLVWGNDKTDSTKLEGYSGLQFLKKLAEEDSDYIIPRTALSNYLAQHVQEAIDLYEDGVAYSIDKKRPTSDNFLKAEDWNAFFNHALYPVLNQLSGKSLSASEQQQIQSVLRTHQAQLRDQGRDYILPDDIPEVLRKVLTWAQTSGNVFIEGETGVGKEGIAKLIHYLGPRANNHFVARSSSEYGGDVNIQISRLFGRTPNFPNPGQDGELGVFLQAAGYTGWVRQGVQGYRLAGQPTNGTLFLDEIQTLKHDVQEKLLRVLDDGVITPLGYTGPQITVNVRVVAATNTNLRQEVSAERFRPDLFYRLMFSGEIRVPPLRERPRDIEKFARVFLKYLCQIMHRGNLVIAKPAVEIFKQQEWPGNIRQLYSVVSKSVELCADRHVGTISKKVAEDAIHQTMGESDSALRRAARGIRVTVSELLRDYCRQQVESERASRIGLQSDAVIIREVAYSIGAPAWVLEKLKSSSDVAGQVLFDGCDWMKVTSSDMCSMLERIAERWLLMQIEGNVTDNLDLVAELSYWSEVKKAYDEQRIPQDILNQILPPKGKSPIPANRTRTINKKLEKRKKLKDENVIHFFNRKLR